MGVENKEGEDGMVVRNKASLLLRGIAKKRG
jgi:hypothetical protein